MPQSLSNVLIHLVFSTKSRNPYLSPNVCHELYPYLTGILRNTSCPVVQIGGVEDHVHILFNLARTVTIAQVVEKVKTSSSKWMKNKSADFSWQSGYGAFSVSPADAKMILTYIKGQEAHHRTRTFQEEFRELLALAGVEADERYVWD